MSAAKRPRNVAPDTSRPKANLAGSGRESIGFRLDQLVGTTPTPDLLVALDEEHERLLGLLRDDQLRSIATARIEGYSVQEIAEQMGIAKRSVERKLDLIRKRWGEEMSDGAPTDPRETGLNALSSDDLIDVTCDEFEAAIRTGQPADLREYLGHVAESQRCRLFTELLYVEFEFRPPAAGVDPREFYLGKFPTHAEEIRGMSFDSLVDTVHFDRPSP